MLNPDGSGNSSNWAGYVVTGANGSVTDVKGSWVVPAVACNGGSVNTYASYWVGIDGYPKGPYLEQIGTDGDCVGGTPLYYAWYEFLPKEKFVQVCPNVEPQAGDQISAEVSFSDGQFTATLTDEMTLQSCVVSETVSGAKRSSAEWIAEDPLNQNRQPFLLDTYGTVFFGQDFTQVPNTCYATVGGLTDPVGGFPGGSIVELTMSTNKSARTVPSSILDQTSFWVTSCSPQPASMVAWWPADGNYKDIIGKDNGHPGGTVSFSPGEVIEAFSFSGAGFVEVPSKAALQPSQVSVAAWVEASSVGPYRYIVDKGVEQCDASYALYTGPSGGLFFYICNDTIGGDVVSPDAGTAIWDGKYHHVVGTFDGSAVRLFVDGLQVGNGTPTAESISYASATPNIFIGSFAGDKSGTFNWRGAIDEVQVFSRALSASEIQAIYNAGPAGICHGE